MSALVRGAPALLALLFACDPNKDGSEDTGDGPGQETGDTDTSTGDDTGPTGETGETGDSAHTGDTGGDTSTVDADGDGSPSDLDCDDSDATVYPGAPEICEDGVRNDCDGAPGGDWESCGLSGLHGIGEGDLRIDGAGESGFLSTAMAVGDLDGDGLDDLIASAPNISEGGTSTGAVYTFKGASLASGSGLIEASTADGVVFGSTAQEQLGTSLATVPDLDGDGLPDVLMGAPVYADEMAYDGAAFLFYGADLLVSPDPLGSRDAALMLSAAHSLDYAGGAVLGQEDLDGDGLGEVWVGSPYEGTGAQSYEGTASLLRSGGALAGATGELSLRAADLEILGTTQNRYSGALMEHAGDLDGDGLEDTWLADVNNPELEFTAGAAQLFLGDTLSDATGSRALDDADMAVVGRVADGLVSAAFIGGEDLDGDGRDDGIIAASGSGTSSVLPGTLHTLYSSGALAGGITGTVEITSSDVQIDGIDDGDQLGKGAVSVGDTDVDGKPDLLIGSDHEICGALGGSAVLVLGGGSWPGTGTLNAEDADAEICGAANDRVGYFLEGPADLNGDGADEVIVGSWAHTGAYSYGGEVSVFWGGGF